jgi:hypothetical protein
VNEGSFRIYCVKFGVKCRKCRGFASTVRQAKEKYAEAAVVSFKTQSSESNTERFLLSMEKCVRNERRRFFWYPQGFRYQITVFCNYEWSCREFKCLFWIELAQAVHFMALNINTETFCFKGQYRLSRNYKEYVIGTNIFHFD